VPFYAISSALRAKDEHEKVGRVTNFDSPPHETLLGSASGANYIFSPSTYMSINLMHEWLKALTSKKVFSFDLKHALAGALTFSDKYQSTF